MPPILKNKSLSELSTFGVGGPARLFAQIQTTDEAAQLMSYCHREQVPFFVVGKGSNSLFDDRGFDGLVILNKISDLSVEENRVIVGGGYSFSLLGIKTARAGLSGLEFASGIPATVGGAVYMNAGANGGETADTLETVEFVDGTGMIYTLSRKQLCFEYRSSSFQTMSGIITQAHFLLESSTDARKAQLAIVEYRMRTQPYGEKSCGCVFRNPSHEGAGALIEQCGLKARRVGGAVVSSLHANFIINEGKATAKDILTLAQEVRECVKEQTGVDLVMELNTIPYTYARISS